MKKSKNIFIIIATLFMMASAAVSLPATSSVEVVSASSRHHASSKIWTKNYRIVGNRRSKIFHIIRGQNYRMSRKNAVFFKSIAAARRAGYRQSKR